MKAWRGEMNTAMGADASKEARDALRRIMKKPRQPPIVAVSITEDESEEKGVRVGTKEDGGQE